MQRRGALAAALLPLSWLFRALAALRRLLYRRGVLRQERVDVPVVVVGNITVGGSGKTPLVLWLAQRLRSRGHAPGIISRGYGGSAEVPRAVRAQDDASVVGDEPLLLARRSDCPVWIGRQRVAAARALLAAHPECDVLISDDGLQHYALARDVEIAVMDERGIGNGWFLPAGPLREGPSRLRTVDALVINGERLPAGLGGQPGRTYFLRLAGTRFASLRRPEVSCGAEELQGRRLHAVAGIGHPQRFFDHLSALGLRFAAHPFPDHHRYTAADLAFADADALLMTEKDAVKCAGLALPETWVLGVDAEVSPAGAAEPGLVELVVEKLNGRPPA
ncbi:MAG: tetraacyldisaccharide 4-kinase [Proteobacteria bacterium]|nr:tetraacyldisaccharide 4-kinase [Pseudomonadota bacterium]